MAGATLCATRLIGKLKGVMPATGPSGKATDDTPASGGIFLPVERKIFAVDASGFFGSDLEGEDGAVHFGARGFDGLAGFLAESASEFLFALRHVSHDLTENALALEGGQAARGAEGADGSGDGGFSVLFSTLHYPSDKRTVIGRSDFDEVSVFVPAAIDKKSVGCYGRDGEFRHDFAPAHIIGLSRAAAASGGALNFPLVILSDGGLCRQ